LFKRRISSWREVRTIGGSIRAGLDRIHDSWGWFVALGIALIALGVVCIMGDVTATLATVLALGWLLVIGAVVALVQAFRAYDWGGFFLYFLSALLRGVAGYVLIRYPDSGEVSITILLAAFFIVGGIFRTVGAASMRFPSWGWTAFSGIVSLVLGFTLIYQLPTASLWFIGFLVGVDFIFDGVALITLGTAVKKVPASREFARA
jgi:uncharacterized membrane protein HdeD (DUF308 family)